MTYRGKVANGVIVLDGDQKLPEGTSVTVQPIVDAKKSGDAIYRLADLAVPTGIPDLARNVDHYLYGHPKVDDGSA